MTAARDVAAGACVELACRPLYQLRRDDATGVWQPQGDDPQFTVSLGDAHRSPGLYRFTARIGCTGDDIQPCVYVADDQRWSEAAKVALQSPLGDGVWSGVIDVGSGLREIRFDPVDAQVEFTLGPVCLQKLDDVAAAAFLVRALVERHPAAELPAARQRLLALIACGDMVAVRTWLAHGDLPDTGTAVPTAGKDGRYAEWVARYDTPDAQELARMSEAVADWPRRPLISIVMPVYNTEERWLRRCLDSVRAQACPDWELCIADDASTAPHVRVVLDEYVARDSRIKVVYRERNGHISAASNSALELATGDHVALLDHDDELAPHALFRVVLAVLAHPRGRLFYSDEDKLDEAGRRIDPYLKPDWNPDLFLSHNFISHLGVYATSLVREVGGFRTGFEGSQDYDLALRCSERLQPDQIVHIPHVLYHWRAIHGSTALAVGEKNYAATAARKALQEHLQRVVCAAEVEFAPAGYRVRRTLPQSGPSIDIIIAVHDGADRLAACLASILAKTTYARFGVTLVTGPSTEEGEHSGPPADIPEARHPGSGRGPEPLAGQAATQSRWVPDIASRFRDDDNNAGAAGELHAAPNPRHPGAGRDPVLLTGQSATQSRWVPDIASRFRDDEQKQGLGAGESSTNPFLRHPGAGPDPVPLTGGTKTQSRWVPDIAARFRDDDNNAGATADPHSAPNPRHPGAGRDPAALTGQDDAPGQAVAGSASPFRDGGALQNHPALRDWVADPRVRILRVDAPCSFPHTVNAAVSRSSADLIVLLDGNTEVITGDWLETLAAHASRPEVGAVGAKLYASDGTIQDAGLVLGLGGLAGYIYRGQPHAARGQMGRACLTQNYSAVSAACLMVARRRFNEVGGLDGTLRGAFHDVDFCLKLRARGYWNVWTPFAELSQHATAGRTDAGTYQSDVAHMQRVWGGQLQDDPAYNPNLSLSGESCGLAFPPRVCVSATCGHGFVDDSRAAPNGDIL